MDFGLNIQLTRSLLYPFQLCPCYNYSSYYCQLPAVTAPAK